MFCSLFPDKITNSFSNMQSIANIFMFIFIIICNECFFIFIFMFSYSVCFPYSYSYAACGWWVGRGEGASIVALRRSHGGRGGQC